MRNRGFTLLEVVLAIGLAGVVLALLTTALDLYLVRVDTSRTQVETAQLARTLLNQIASDLRAARYFSPSSSADEGGNASDDGFFEDSSLVQGIFGTATELRIDRSAAWQWEYQTRLAEVANEGLAVEPTPVPEAMPQTVRYLLGEGKELLADKLAETGVGEESLATGYAGLYREQVSTAAWLAENASLESTLGSANTGSIKLGRAELIAPEVVDIAFQYFDGYQLLTEWDSSLAEGLPKAIEIHLTLLEEPFEQAVTRTPNDRDELRRNKENLVEYRLVVNLSNLREPHPAEFSQPNGSSR